MIHRHTSRAASDACTDEECIARAAVAEALGLTEVAAIEREANDRRWARVRRGHEVWAKIKDEVHLWQAEVRKGVE